MTGRQNPLTPAPADATIDAGDLGVAMSAPGANEMIVVHNGFRCALAVAPTLIIGARGDDNRRARVAAFLTSSLTIAETHHHEEEGSLFPMLVEQAPQAKTAVEAGIEEHHEMAGLLVAAKASVEAWALNETEGTDVISALAAFNSVFSAHLDHEEAVIVPLLEEHIDVETWTMLQAQLTEHLPQLAGLLLPVAYGLSLLWEAVGETAITDMLTQTLRAG